MHAHEMLKMVVSTGMIEADAAGAQAEEQHARLRVLGKAGEGRDALRLGHGAVEALVRVATLAEVVGEQVEHLDHLREDEDAVALRLELGEQLVEEGLVPSEDEDTADASLPSREGHYPSPPPAMPPAPAQPGGDVATGQVAPPVPVPVPASRAHGRWQRCGPRLATDSSISFAARC